MKRRILLVGLIVVLVVVTAGCGGGGGNNLDGRWEEQSPSGNVEGIVIEFRGNRITQMVYRELGVDRQITAEDLERGGFNTLRPTGFWNAGNSASVSFQQWHRQHGTNYEIVRQQADWRNVYQSWVGTSDAPVGVDPVDAHFVLIRESTEGTFSISDGRIEINWQDGRGIQVEDFARTENTMDIGRTRYIRAVASPPQPAQPAPIPAPPPPVPIPTQPEPALTPETDSIEINLDGMWKAEGGAWFEFSENRFTSGDIAILRMPTGTFTKSGTFLVREEDIGWENFYYQIEFTLDDEEREDELLVNIIPRQRIIAPFSHTRNTNTLTIYVFQADWVGVEFTRVN